jgi:hypothetical protein
MTPRWPDMGRAEQLPHSFLRPCAQAPSPFPQIFAEQLPHQNRNQSHARHTRWWQEWSTHPCKSPWRNTLTSPDSGRTARSNNEIKTESRIMGRSRMERRKQRIGFRQWPCYWPGSRWGTRRGRRVGSTPWAWSRGWGGATSWGRCPGAGTTHVATCATPPPPAAGAASCPPVPHHS